MARSVGKNELHPDTVDESIPRWQRSNPTIVEGHVARYLRRGEEPYMDVRFYIQPDVNSAAGKRAAIKEFRDCLRCATCTERFPCPPNKQNIKEWERSGYGDPGFMRDFGYDRVKDSRCPMCGSEVSLGMFKLIFQGVLDEDDKLLRNEHGEVML